jgi:hypothetical protein
MAARDATTMSWGDEAEAESALESATAGIGGISLSGAGERNDLRWVHPTNLNTRIQPQLVQMLSAWIGSPDHCHSVHTKTTTKSVAGPGQFAPQVRESRAAEPDRSHYDSLGCVLHWRRWRSCRCIDCAGRGHELRTRPRGQA